MLRQASLLDATPENYSAAQGRYGTHRDRHHVYGGYVSYKGSPHKSDSKIFEDVMARLTLVGLAFSSTAQTARAEQQFKMQFHPGETLFVPSWIEEALPAPSATIFKESKPAPKHTLSTDPQAFIRDLYLYWDCVRKNKISLIKAGYVNKRGLKLLNSHLILSDANLAKAQDESFAPRLFQIRQLLIALGALQVAAQQLLAVTTPAIAQLWQQNSLEQISQSIAALKQIRNPFYLSDTSVYYHNFDFNTAINALFSCLPNLTKDHWYDVDETVGDVTNPLQELPLASPWQSLWLLLQSGF